jgi:hypothetical protein
MRAAVTVVINIPHRSPAAPVFPPFAHIAVTVTDLQRSSLWLVWIGRTGVDARAVVGIVGDHRASSDAQRDGEIERCRRDRWRPWIDPTVPGRIPAIVATRRPDDGQDRSGGQRISARASSVIGVSVWRDQVIAAAARARVLP